MSGVVGGFGSCGSCGSCGGGWTFTGTILVLFILLVIVSRTFMY
ncbi:YjcZ family sporulation protein [Paenibacillus sp. D2_2]|nr:YjcZ family sporulation protein [Paenibacillus sp. D2_2]WMT39436.1 YjcZ family sporulation protein [Paenibacillus sp. D2_2]